MTKGYRVILTATLGRSSINDVKNMLTFNFKTYLWPYIFIWLDFKILVSGGFQNISLLTGKSSYIYQWMFFFYRHI